MGPYNVKIASYPSILFIFGLIFFQLATPMATDGATAAHTNEPKTIVIDPGHGGADHGAKGVQGTLEKQLVLTLAKLIARHLNQTYRVLLTRTGDYEVPLFDRTALANHHEAILFISIHLGAAFHDDITESLIMHYNPQQSQPPSLYSNMPDISNHQSAASDQWERNQLDVIPVSKRIAETVRAELNQRSTATPFSVTGAALSVLAGASVPALYVEPFYLTQPDAESHFQDLDNLERLAKDVALAITAALKKAGH